MVGTVSNVQSQLQGEIFRVLHSLSDFKVDSIFLVESDSIDLTLKVLKDFNIQNPNFSFVSLGNLKSEYPNRIERLRKCRNEYVNWVRNESDSDFICVVDLDGMNRAISSQGIKSVFTVEKSWDACFSNQLNGYSDLYALRCANWVDFDIFQRMHELRQKYTQRFPIARGFSPKISKWLIEDLVRRETIYRNMRKISLSADWIKVDSAFGGFGIYRRECFLNANYGTPNGENIVGSEHLELHAQMILQKRELFIVPSLVNANWNTYNINRYFLIRQFREFARQSKFVSRFLRFVFMR